MSKAKAQELIAQFKQYQQAQVQCLQALFSLDVAEEAEAEAESSMKNKNTATDESSVRHGPPQGKIYWMPNDWGVPWSNDLLRERIKQRETEPGCGGGLRRDIPNVDAADPAAKFIAANALNSLTGLRNLGGYSFEKETPSSNNDNQCPKEGNLNTCMFVTQSPLLPSATPVLSSLRELYIQISAFTIPYFRLTEDPPAGDTCPLSSSGKFGLDTKSAKYIREEKFSLSVSRCGWDNTHEPSLMVVLNPLTQYRDWLSGKPIAWIRGNLFHIRHCWEEVLDALDVQTTLSSSLTFNNEARQDILFEDRNFTNSKRYFWALQSLRLFAEHIEVTSRVLDGIVYTAREMNPSSFEGYEEKDRLVKEYRENFGKLRDRIERKRQAVQSLSDGLFSASSVAEGRLASEQNGNIRLLTMVTIAYLPLSLATSIYSMDALPRTAGLVSYVVVTIIMCVITYVAVLEIRRLKNGVAWVRKRVKEMVRSKEGRAGEGNDLGAQGRRRASMMA
ncbi:MAG: hypothetical protein Q9220_006788 [cf. Caloplaca sp. 1 TL-2023]